MQATLRRNAHAAIESLGTEVVRARLATGSTLADFPPGFAHQLAEECVAYLFRLLVLQRLEDGHGMDCGIGQIENAELFGGATSAFHTGIVGTTRSLQNLAGELPQGRFLDPHKTPLIQAVVLRDSTLQRIVQLLATARGGKLAELGQLYEGFLSYSGVFARETIYELRPPREAWRSMFVPASQIDGFPDKAFCRDKQGNRRKYPPGVFLFRKLGRRREQTAAFYTPEVLAQSLTRHTIHTRLCDGRESPEVGACGAQATSLSAEQILRLTICEPAMGSGVFLAACVEQLATAYLQQRSHELGTPVPAEDYAREHARVRWHFVANQCYGVDLNPTTVELAKIIAWLDVGQKDLPVPALALRIRDGDSVIGARREVVMCEQLSGDSVEWNRLQLLPVGASRGAGIYHFLLPDQKMAFYEGDRGATKLCRDLLAKLRAWRAEMAQPYSPGELRRLQSICDEIDKLWAEHLRIREQALAVANPAIRLWGQNGGVVDIHQRAHVDGDPYQPGSPYHRLRAVMDYWCNLWIWPIEQVDSLPTRGQWLTRVEAMLRGEGLARVTRLRPFFHWELEFPEVAKSGGFDIILGNPPWIKQRWQEAHVLESIEPALAVRKLRAKQVADLRAQILARPGARSTYLRAMSEGIGTSQYFSAGQNYPLLEGVQTNLYKCFMARCWQLLHRRGVLGLLHQPGVFDDPRGGQLRAELVRRASLVVWAKNQLKLFPEVHHECPFAYSVTRGQVGATRFDLVANLFHPHTLDACREHNGAGEVPGIKDERGEWDLRPHRSRVVPVDRAAMALFAELYDAPGTPVAQARLPVVHSREFVGILRKFATYPHKLRKLDGAYYCSEFFHETNQQKDGTIVRKTVTPSDIGGWVVSGPHFHLGTPFSKTPNPGCRHNQDYAVVDLATVAGEFVPRTNYTPGYRASPPTCSQEGFQRRVPSWNGRPLTDFYRHVHREMVGPTAERTLISALIPPRVTHINTVFSIAFLDPLQLLAFTGMSHSLPADFFVKSTGMGHINRTLSEQLPLASPAVLPWVVDRTLRLNCLSEHYAELWDRYFPEQPVASASPDPRCAGWEQATRPWSCKAPLRTAYARRQALVELDALAALSIGLTLAELLLLYRIQFPVLQQYERETFFDRHGKIVFTVNRGLRGVGVRRKLWQQIQDAQSPAHLPNSAQEFAPPFDRCDRAADLAQAYDYFARLLADTKQRSE